MGNKIKILPCSVHLLGRLESLCPTYNYLCNRIIRPRGKARRGGAVSGGCGSPVAAPSFRAGQDYHLERKEATQARALGHAMGRHTRAGSQPRRARRDALQQEHIRLPASRLRGRLRVLQRLPPRQLPALREPSDRPEGQGPRRAAEVLLQNLRALLLAGDGDDLRRRQAARLCLGGLRAPGGVVRERQRHDQGRQEVRHHRALLDGEAVRRARGHPGRRRALGQGLDRRDLLAPCRRGRGSQAGREAAPRDVKEPAVHRRRG